MIQELDLGLVHGSCVDFDGKSILAIGTSGKGKSSLALQLIGLGGTLVADDQVIVSSDKYGAYVEAPSTISGQIEARGIGILNCPSTERSQLNLIVDMSVTETVRLPETKTVTVGSHQINLIAGQGVENLPIAARLLNLFGYSQFLDVPK